MQKEDLLKRIRTFATLVTMAFVILVVGLLVQFGMIAHNHTEQTRLENANAETKNQIEKTERELEYIKNGEYVKDQQIIK